MSSEDDEPRPPAPSRGSLVNEEEQDEEAWFRRRQQQRERGEAADSDDEQKKKGTVASIFNAIPMEREGENFAAGDGDDDDDGKPKFDANGNPIIGRRRRRLKTHNSLYRQGVPSKLARRHPREPAAGLSIDSMSAYAPFQGFPMQWMSQVYDDAAT